MSEERPILQTTGTVAVEGAAIANSQLLIIETGADTTRTLGFKIGNKLFQLQVAEYGSGTRRDVEGLTVVAQVGFIGDGSGITGITEEQLDGYTGPWLPLTAGSGKALTGDLYIERTIANPSTISSGSSIYIHRALENGSATQTSDISMGRDGGGNLYTEISVTTGGATGLIRVFSDRVDVEGIRAFASGGILFESHNGTDIALMGAGGGAGVTWYGNHIMPNLAVDGISINGATRTGVERLKIGTRNGGDQCSVTSGEVLTADLSGHGFTDAALFSPSGNGKGYACYDAQAASGGASTKDHMISFQARINHVVSSGLIDNIQGVKVFNNVDGACNQHIGYQYTSPTGAGAITNEFGLFISDITRGTNKYGIYIAGSGATYGLLVEGAPTKLGGAVEVSNTSLTVNGATDATWCTLRGKATANNAAILGFDFVGKTANAAIADGLGIMHRYRVENAAGTSTSIGRFGGIYDAAGSYFKWVNGTEVEAARLTGAGVLSLADGLILPKTAGKGIKVDTVSPTFAYRDLLGTRVVDTVGATAPSLTAFRGGNCRRLAYGAGDRQQWEFHFDHDIIAGSNPVFIHVHWMHNGTAISGNLVITLSITYAKGHNQQAYPVEKTQTITYNTTNIATTPQYTEIINEIQLSDATGSGNYIVGNDIEPDGIVSVDLTVTTLPTITGGTSSEVFIPFCDIHYLSSGIGTKAKAPNFYT